MYVTRYVSCTVLHARQMPPSGGGDTGFLNAFFSDWYARPPEARLPFGCNAQRTLHWMTYAKQPGYWRAVQPLRVIHYSSSPKPWEEGGGRKKGELEMVWWNAFVEAKTAPLAGDAGAAGGLGGAAALIGAFLG